jgi:hypothetical protein
MDSSLWGGGNIIIQGINENSWKEYLTLRSKSFHVYYHSPLSLFSFTNLRDTEFIQ